MTATGQSDMSQSYSHLNQGSMGSQPNCIRTATANQNTCAGWGPPSICELPVTENLAPENVTIFATREPDLCKCSVRNSQSLFTRTGKLIGVAGSPRSYWVDAECTIQLHRRAN